MTIKHSFFQTLGGNGNRFFNSTRIFANSHDLELQTSVKTTKVICQGSGVPFSDSDHQVMAVSNSVIGQFALKWLFFFLKVCRWEKVLVLGNLWKLTKSSILRLS